VNALTDTNRPMCRRTLCESIKSTFNMGCVSNLQSVFIVLFGTLLLFVHCSEVSNYPSYKNSHTHKKDLNNMKQSLQTLGKSYHSPASARVNDVNRRNQQSKKRHGQHLVNSLNNRFTSHDNKQATGRLLSLVSF